MPRNELDFPSRIDSLSVLAEDGSVDQALMPDLESDFLKRLYRTMLLSRRFDERLLTLQKQGRIGTFAPAIGQEATQIGAAACLRDEDWVVPSYRDSAASLWRGIPLSGLMLYDAGWNEGGQPPEGQRDLPICVPVASQIPHAVGLAYAAHLRESDEVALVFFGDGATSEGDFHEAINFAGVHRLPVLFCCQNNQYAISTPLKLQTRSQTIAQKAIAYGVHGIQVDGNDIFAVHVACSEAIERARTGDGPTLVEAVTYRLSVHTTADDPSVYRDDKEVNQWKEKDPIGRFQKYLVAKEVLTEDDVETLEKEIEQQIEQAWREAEQKMDSFDQVPPIFAHLLADKTDSLSEQQKQLQSLADGVHLNSNRAKESAEGKESAGGKDSAGKNERRDDG